MLRYTRLKRLNENDMVFNADNLKWHLDHLDANKCKDVIDSILKDINDGIRNTDFSRLGIDNDIANYIIELIPEDIGIEKTLYEGNYISWNVKLYDARNYDERFIEKSIDDINKYASVTLKGRNNGHLVLNSIGCDMFKYYNGNAVDLFRTFFDIVHSLNEDFIDDICDDYTSIYNLVEMEIYKYIDINQGTVRIDDFWSVVMQSPVVLSDEFTELLTNIDTDVNEVMEILS